MTSVFFLSFTIFFFLKMWILTFFSLDLPSYINEERVSSLPLISGIQTVFLVALTFNFVVISYLRNVAKIVAD